MDALHISIRTLLTTYGEEFCCDKQFVNYLSDYSQFDPPALRTIMQSIVDGGYSSGLLKVKHDGEDWQTYIKSSVARIVKRNGFEDTYVSYCFQCLCYGLKLVDRVDDSMLSNNMAGTTTTTFSSNSTPLHQDEQTQWLNQKPKQTHRPNTPAFQPYSPTPSINNSNKGYGVQQGKRPNKKRSALTLFGLLTFILVFSIIGTLVSEKDSTDNKTYKYGIYNNDYGSTDFLDDFDYGTTIGSEDTSNIMTVPDYDINTHQREIDSMIKASQKEIDSILSATEKRSSMVSEQSREYEEWLLGEDHKADDAPLNTTSEPSKSRNERGNASRSGNESRNESRGSDESPDVSNANPSTPNSGGLRSKARRYYNKAKEKVMEGLGIDKEEAKEKWDEMKGEAKEKWDEMKGEAKEKWRDIKESFY